MTQKQNSQRGSAILIILITVSLFAALSYAFLQGSKTNIGWLQKENSKANATALQTCANNNKGAQKRLEARGCTSTNISYAEDGSNSRPGAPSDGSCSIYHPNGGGIKVCPSIDDQCMLGLSVGQSCNGVIYAGVSGGRRIYAAPTDSGEMAWGVQMSEGLGTNASDGLANTNLLVGNTGGAGYPYSAAIACRALGLKFYLPATDELIVLYNVRNTGDFAGTFSNIGGARSTRYWTSHSVGTANARYIRFNAFINNQDNRYEILNIRCIRRD